MYKVKFMREQNVKWLKDGELMSGRVFEYGDKVCTVRECVTGDFEQVATDQLMGGVQAKKLRGKR
jgi:hypothetical protein